MPTPGVEFEEDSFMAGRRPTADHPNNSAAPHSGYGKPQSTSNAPKMAQWLMKHGIKSENGAQIILFCVIAFNIILSFLVYKFFL